MITITYVHFENCIKLQIITITHYDYLRSGAVQTFSHSRENR